MIDCMCCVVDAVNDAPARHILTLSAALLLLHVMSSGPKLLQDVRIPPPAVFVCRAVPCCCWACYAVHAGLHPQPVGQQHTLAGVPG
jgi:hypothetical protein